MLDKKMNQKKYPADEGNRFKISQKAIIYDSEQEKFLLVKVANTQGIFFEKYGPWEFIAIMTCDNWTNVRAMQVEWLIRYPTRKKPRPQAFSGARGRIQSLVEVCKRIDEIADIRLYIHPLYFDMAKGLGLNVLSLEMITMNH